MSVRERSWTTAKGEARKAYIADYTDQHGKRHIKTFRLKKDAMAFAAEAVDQVNKGTHTPTNQGVTVKEAADQWLARCRSGTAEHDPLEPSTVREYENHVRLYIDDATLGIGKQKLAQLTPAAVNAFLQRLREAGKSQALVKKVRSSLSALISDAMDNGLVHRHVLREMAQRRKRRKSRERREVEIPTKDELRALMNETTGGFRAFLVTAIFTGLRASELRGLAWDNVDLDKGILKVRQRADRWNNIGAPKSATSNRDIPLSPIVVNTLKEWKLACPLLKERDDEPGRLWLVFPNGKGKVQALANIYSREFAPLQLKLGMAKGEITYDDNGTPHGTAKYGFHALRHAAASLFIEQGFGHKKVQALMGHSSIQMTFDTYGHLFPSPDDDQAAMAQIQARLVGDAT